MTLYLLLTSARRRRNLQGSMLRSALQEQMDSGAFDDAHPDIVRVVYREPPASPDDDTPAPITTRSNNDLDVNDKIVWPIVAAAIVLVCIALYWILRRRRNRDANEEVDHEDMSEDDNRGGVEAPSSEPVKAVHESGDDEPTSQTMAPSLAREHLEKAEPEIVVSFDPGTVIHHSHSHPPPTTDVEDDIGAALHPSRAETSLLRILDRHENLDVEHLHEHIR